MVSHHDIVFSTKILPWIDRIEAWMTFVRSGSVVTAILAEVKPHIAKMKGARSQLQKSIDAAKVGLGLRCLGYTRGNIYQWTCVCMLHNTYWLYVGFKNLRDGQNWPWSNIKHVFPDPQLRNNCHEACCLALQVGSIGTLLEDAEAADVAVAAFNTFMAAYHIK